jgi:predicted Zn finger-like uncharacterized protein
MKITCQACAAKYTIADEKVLGKIVKIRCKKCGATIVVNGNDPSASAGSAGAEPPHAFDYASQGAQADGWTVNVADGDQRTMADAEIVAGYHAGWITDETYCWKDGMTDWLPLREIEQLYAACTATRAMNPAGMLPDQGITKIDQTPGLLVGSPAAAPVAYAAPRPAAGMGASPGNGGLASTAPAAPAARRAGGRAPTADLFSNVAQAGGEDDVMTSAPAGMPQVHDDPQKLTGMRNENSVLFSLNALTTKPGSNRPAPNTMEASGLIDIRNLGAQIGIGEDKKKSRIDDIMNLAGGGAFSPALNAPVLAPPPIEEYAPPPDVGVLGGRAVVAPPKSKAIIFGAVFAGVVVVAGAIGAAIFFIGGKSDEEKAAASASAATASPSASMAMNSGGPADTTASSGTAPPPDSATASSTSTTPTTATTKPAATTAKTAATKETPPAATKEPPTAATKETPPAATTAAAAAGADQPFNMGEAKARLASIAGSVQGCKKGDLTGSGRVVVTFAPSGNAQSAVVSGAPFEGTPTGACVASRFRGAHVPPFSGSPFSVSKSFTIN